MFDVSIEFSMLNFIQAYDPKLSKKSTKLLIAKEEKKTVNSQSPLNVHSHCFSHFESELNGKSNILRDDLTYENYKEKFHLLLCLEEQEHEKQLKER